MTPSVMLYYNVAYSVEPFCHIDINITILGFFDVTIVIEL